MQPHRVPIRLGTVSTQLKTSIASNCIQPSGPLNRICKTCTSKYARYTCPRCNAPYCSAECYKTHSTGCTEAFFRQHVADEMQLDEKNAESKREMKKQMQQMLQRIHQQRCQNEEGSPLPSSDQVSQALDENEEAQMMQRLEQLALLEDDQLSLECLTEQERERFLKDLSSGQLSRFVAVWQPWWLGNAKVYQQNTQSRRRTLIEELDVAVVGPSEDGKHADEDEDDEGNKSANDLTIESLAHPVQVFTDTYKNEMPTDVSSLLGGKPPSELLKFNLIEVIFAYVVVLRSFNGDWRADPMAAAVEVLDLSGVLRENAKFGSVKKAVLACLPKRLANDFVSATDTQSAFLWLQDVALVLRTRIFLLDAMSDLRCLLQSAARACSDRKLRKTLVASTRKVFFFVVYAFHQDSEDLFELAARLERQIAAIQVVSTRQDT